MRTTRLDSTCAIKGSNCDKFVLLPYFTKNKWTTTKNLRSTGNSKSLLKKTPYQKTNLFFLSPKWVKVLSTEKKNGCVGGSTSKQLHHNSQQEEEIRSQLDKSKWRRKRSWSAHWFRSRTSTIAGSIERKIIASTSQGKVLGWWEPKIGEVVPLKKEAIFCFPLGGKSFLLKGSRRMRH